MAFVASLLTSSGETVIRLSCYKIVTHHDNKLKMQDDSSKLLEQLNEPSCWLVNELVTSSASQGW